MVSKEEILNDLLNPNTLFLIMLLVLVIGLMFVMFHSIFEDEKCFYEKMSPQWEGYYVANCTKQKFCEIPKSKVCPICKKKITRGYI